VNKPRDVVIRVSLSATIAPAETRAVVRGAVEIDLSVNNPDVMWLRSPVQLDALGKFRETLQSVRDNMTGCQRIHLFYAGPTGRAMSWVIPHQIEEG
jgi:hypothetical protein